MALGLLLALAYVDGPKVLRALVAGDVEVVRNAPLLLWVYLVFYGLPQATGLRYDREVSFVATLSCYGAAYLVEVFRAGLQSVPRGQIDAGYAIGMTSPQVLLHVRLPTMFRIILPALSNACISLFKDTSIAMVLGIPELAFTAQWINTSTFRVVEAWIVILPLYLVTTYAIILVLRRLERRFKVA
jgi:polar amino acid transport system permease protein